MDTAEAMATMIRQARQTLKAHGEKETRLAVAALVGCNERTVRRHWAATAPAEDALPTMVGTRRGMPPNAIHLEPRMVPQTDAVAAPRRPNPGADVLPTTPPPPPRVAIGIDDLRQYVADPIGHGGFGNNVRLDEREYPLLQQLEAECHAAMTEASLETMQMYGNEALLKAAALSPEALPLRMAQDRWSRARQQVDFIQYTMQRIRDDAKAHGRIL